MESKFKVGQKVIIVDGYECDSSRIANFAEGVVLTIQVVRESNYIDPRYIYGFEETRGVLHECRLAAIDGEGWVKWSGGKSWPQWLGKETEVEIEDRSGGVEEGRACLYDWTHVGGSGDIIAYRTEHTKNAMKDIKEKELKGVKIHYHVKDDEITKEDLLGSRSHRIEEFDGGRAPTLWNLMKDKMTPEELENLRQVILDVSLFGKNVKNIDCAFCWSNAKQCSAYWHSIYNKYFGEVSQEELIEEQEVAAEDNGSAATSKHYNSKLIQPIEISQMVLTSEEFKGAMKFNIMKYTQRAGSKDGEASEKDWNKAKQYKLWLELAEQGVTINPREHVV